MRTTTGRKTTTQKDRTMTKNFKAGDKFTIVGVGFGYVREICPNGYYVYFVNQGRCGAGYHDIDLQAGWSRRQK
jgi:RAB protein geranylgeranyltransferase component A